jgi:hypothetical protein
MILTDLCNQFYSETLAMKITDLLEDRDSIRIYWQLRNDIDIESYFNAYTKIINDQNNFRARQDMLELSSYVHALLTNPDWQHIENDPDFDKLYDDLYELYESIQLQLNRK